MKFWSDTGVSREQWLAAFRAAIVEKGIPFREDDGWRWFDLELNPTHWISRSVVTVTEYHGGERMLTRIGVQQRVRRMLYVIAALPCVLAIALPSLSSLGESSWLKHSLGAAAALLSVWIAGGWVFSERRLQSIIREAAERVGLKQIKAEAPHARVPS
jgi:hypothetical protein